LNRRPLDLRRPSQISETGLSLSKEFR